MEAHQTLKGEGLDQVLRARYRVHYWERPTANHAWNLDAWILSDCANVFEALAWSSDHSAGRHYQVFVISDCGAEGDRMVLLAGANTNTSSQHP